MNLSVQVRTTQVSSYFINVEGQWGLEKYIVLKFYSSFRVLCPRSWVEFEYHESLYSTPLHPFPQCQFSGQIIFLFFLKPYTLNPKKINEIFFSGVHFFSKQENSYISVVKSTSPNGQDTTRVWYWKWGWFINYNRLTLHNWSITTDQPHQNMYSWIHISSHTTTSLIFPLLPHPLPNPLVVLLMVLRRRSSPLHLRLSPFPCPWLRKDPIWLPSGEECFDKG